jgi:hypothetical protein
MVEKKIRREIRKKKERKRRGIKESNAKKRE